jgi:SNF2 family DNA or RNA helicase
MSEENQNQKRRVILVRKQSKPSNEKVGIERYDEYIQQSGLEAKQYQREGVEFCLRREAVVGGGATTVVRGGIIADEMGLGKTMMMMGLILANLAAYRRTLIVVPVALIAQWVAQIKRTIIDSGVKSDLSVFVFHGSAGKRRVVLSEGRDGMVWWPRPPKTARAAAIFHAWSL